MHSSVGIKWLLRSLPKDESEMGGGGNAPLRMVPVTLAGALSSDLMGFCAVKSNQCNKRTTSGTHRNFMSWERTDISSCCYSPQKEIHGSKEQNGEPRDKPTHLRSINPQQRRQEYTMEKRQFPQQVVWESWIATCRSIKLEHIIYKNILNTA